MKKIFTIILVASGTISFASAQSNNQRNIARNDNKKVNTYYSQHSSFEKTKGVVYNDNYFSYKEKQQKPEMINREYDQKIVSVKYNRHLSGREKSNQIQWLQMQRKNEISRLEYQFEKSNQKVKSRDSFHAAKKW
ncbi:MAG: hypothetical protein ABI285_04970 [Ginsengibacter sp.]